MDETGFWWFSASFVVAGFLINLVAILYSLRNEENPIDEVEELDGAV